MHVGTIIATIGIILDNCNQIPYAIEEYLIKMGPNCIITRDKGINSKTIYHSIYAISRWINQNIMGISHMSLFYTLTLHVADCIIFQDPHFCICPQRFPTIIDTRMRSRPILPLLCLVTQLCHNFYLMLDVQRPVYI